MTDRSVRWTKLLGASLIGLSVATPAVAQDEGASTSGDIIVTARRSEERLQDVPISITVLNQSQLAAHNILTGEDLARTTPSLQVNNNFGTDNTMFSIRGFSQDIGSAATVGTYFADVVSPRGGSFQTPAGEGAGPGAFFDLQNVQVLKGPQGTLQGRNTTGGAVMLVPQKPTDQLEGYVEGTLGNFSALGVQGVINIPINDTFKVRLGVDRQKRDGYLINRSGIGPRDYANLNYTAVRASVVADLTPNLENYMIASFSDSNTHGNVQKVTAAGEEGSLSGFALDQLQRQAQFGFYDLLTDMPVSQVRTRQWQIINTTTWQASDNLKIKNIISYAEYRQTLRQPEFGTNFQVNNANGFNNLVSFLNNTYNRSGNPGLDPLNLPNNAALLATLHGLADTPGLGFNYAQINPRPGGYDTAAEATFTEELQLQGTGLDDRLNWQGGFYFERATPLGNSGVQTTVESQCQDINSTSPNCFSPLAVAASAYYQALLANGVPPATAAQLGILPVGGYNPSVFSNTLQDTALYLQATYKLTDRLSLTGGFRYTWDKVSNADDPRFVGFAIDPLTGALSSQTYCAASALPAPAEGCYKANSAKSSAPTWLIDVDWKPIDNVLVYAKWARGYRAGGLKPDVVAAVTALIDYAQNPLPTFGTTYQVDSWKPEKVDAFEVGLKSSFHGVISGTFNVAGFYNKFSNQQVLLGLSSLTAPVPGQSSIYNAGRSRIYGVEVDTSLSLFRGFELNVGYTYLNTKAQEVSVLPGIYATPSGALTIVNPSAVVGLPLSYSPKNKVVVNGNYTLPLDEHIGEVTFGATFTHTDSQYGTYNDIGVPSLTVNRAGQTVLSTADLGLIQATNILDLNFSWRKVLGSQFDLSAFATNVTGVKYYTGVPGLLGLGVEVSSIGAPRIWGARLKVHF